MWGIWFRVGMAYKSSLVSVRAVLSQYFNRQFHNKTETNGAFITVLNPSEKQVQSLNLIQHVVHETYIRNSVITVRDLKHTATCNYLINIRNTNEQNLVSHGTKFRISGYRVRGSSTYIQSRQYLKC